MLLNLYQPETCHRERVSYRPPGDLESSRDFTNDEGPTPVDHTNRPYGTSVPSVRISFCGLTSLTIPRTR
jgi:hypothetical protein